jgi:drug/metabolite transporter (DMT)-like permease
MMLIASLAFGFMNVTVKMISGMHVSEIVFFRALVQILIASVILFKQKESPIGKNPKMLFMRGLFGSLGLLCYFYSLQLMPLSNALVIHYISPILTTILAMLMGDERVRPIQWFFFLICIFGVIIVNSDFGNSQLAYGHAADPKSSSHGMDGNSSAWGNFSWNQIKILQGVTPFGILMGLGGAFFSAFAYNTIRRLKGIENPNVVVLYFPLVTIPISLIFPFGGWGSWYWPSGMEWIWLLLTGVFTQVGQFFMTRAYQEAETKLVSAISYAGIIWGTAFGLFLFNESYNMFQYLGMGLVILGMVLNVQINKQTSK